MARFHDPDPTSHFPDPSKRYQVMLMERGGIPFINVLDTEAQKDLDVDVAAALGLAVDVILQVQRFALLMGEQLEAIIETELSEQFPKHELGRLRNLWRQN